MDRTPAAWEISLADRLFLAAKFAQLELDWANSDIALDITQAFYS
jgi:hypothetical protein